MYDIDFIQNYPAFSHWLKENGCQILEPTNIYEVARFTTSEGVGIVYRNSNGIITKMTGGADKLYSTWESGRKFEYAMRTQRIKRRDKKRNELIAKIAMRDGWECMYCGNTLNKETATIEHIVALATRGTEHIANMSLACSYCNNAVGNMSVRQKLEFALKNRR